MNVANQLREIPPASTNDRLMSSPEEMSDSPISAIEVLALPRREPLHYLSYGFRLPLDQKVDVIEKGNTHTDKTGNVPLALQAVRETSDDHPWSEICTDGRCLV